MKATLIAISRLIEHFYVHRVNYLMFAGIGCILSYVYANYGFQTSLLLVGILLTITSMIIEINKVSKKK